jgi:hypothetical protein
MTAKHLNIDKVPHYYSRHTAIGATPGLKLKCGVLSLALTTRSKASQLQMHITTDACIRTDQLGPAASGGQ